MSNPQIPALTEASRSLGALDSLRIKRLEEQASALRNSVICAFNQLLDLKDLNTGVHSTRLAEWGMRVGQELGLEEAELQNLEVAALLHDIGKVGIPDAILRKPERLDTEEYALMKRHSEYGWAVLRMLPGFERAALDILHHHESFDGKGYPAGLKGTEIPVVSRIVCVIDAFDAMVSTKKPCAGSPKRVELSSILSSFNLSSPLRKLKCPLSSLLPARRFPQPCRPVAKLPRARRWGIRYLP